MTVSVTKGSIVSVPAPNQRFNSRVNTSADGYSIGWPNNFVPTTSAAAGGFPEHHAVTVNSDKDTTGWLIAKGREEIQRDPLSNLSLHREFADLRTDKDILKFAAKFGELGVPVWLENQQAIENSDRYVSAERLSDWRREIAALGSLINIFDAAREDELDHLDKYFKIDHSSITLSYASGWNKCGLEYFSLAPPRGIPDYFEVPKLRHKFDLFNLRYVYVARVSHNDHLVSLNRNEGLHAVAKRYVYSQVGNRITSSLKPVVLSYETADIGFNINTLLAAVWFQFWQEISGRASQVRCRMCPKWIVDATKRRRYCSGRCKQKGSRSDKNR